MQIQLSVCSFNENYFTIWFNQQSTKSRFHRYDNWATEENQADFVMWKRSVGGKNPHTPVCINSGQPQQQQQLHVWYGGIKPTNRKHERLYSAAIELAIINRRSNIRQIVFLSHGLSIHDRTNSVMPPNSLPQNTCGWTDRHSTLEARALFDDHFIWFCANTIQGGPQIAELPTYH